MIYVLRKTRYKRVEESVKPKPILPPLEEATQVTPHGLKTYLVTAYGLPFTDNGFGNKMRDWPRRRSAPNSAPPIGR
jgi:hypothetical protein